MIPPKRDLKILLIGDCCVDEYHYGSVDRISPEAPVPVLKVTRVDQRMGMGGNVLLNLQSFGCNVTFQFGTAKCIKKRYIDEHSKQHIVRVDEESVSLPFDPETIQDYTIFDAVVISDYNKGYLTYGNIAAIRKKYNGPIFIDTKKRDLKQFNTFFIKINQLEYDNRQSDAERVIVTMGSRGTWYNHSIHTTEKVDVVDVCGAGDTFLAALTYAFINTSDIISAIKFANKCAAVTVTHSGVYALTDTDINKIVNDKA